MHTPFHRHAVRRGLLFVLSLLTLAGTATALHAQKTAASNAVCADPRHLAWPVSEVPSLESFGATTF